MKTRATKPWAREKHDGKIWVFFSRETETKHRMKTENKTRQNNEQCFGTIEEQKEKKHHIKTRVKLKSKKRVK